MDSTVTPTVTADDSPRLMAADHGVSDSSAAPAPAPADELLIEEISIDGMCGVY
jgi:mycofactocin precursor